MRGKHPANPAQSNYRSGGKHARRFPQIHGVPRFSEALLPEYSASTDRLRERKEAGPPGVFVTSSRAVARRNDQFGSGTDEEPCWRRTLTRVRLTRSNGPAPMAPTHTT